MKLTPQDWLKLRNPLVFLVLVLVAIAALILYTQQQKNAAEQALQTQTNQLNQARQRYLASGQEKDTISQYLPKYQTLLQQGFVGEERRIEWVDALRKIHGREKLFNINYSIGAQEEYQPNFISNAGSIKLYRSVMKLELSMLHEGDLLTLIEDLRQQQGAPFMVRQCEITRQNAVISNSFAPNMHADCELDWVTIHEPQNVGGTP
ncbi:MAG TPA: hypothetical protein VGJ90_12140 [Methylophilaceae bacterium]|jgi:hypothetical protein